MAPIEFDRRKKKTKDLDSRLTPSEIAKILEEGDAKELPFVIAPLLAAGEQPVSYAREAWCENVTYYSANRGARSLIVAFYDGGRCVGVPISYFLQMLRDDLYDVLALNDPRKLFFDRGIPGFSTSFLETSRAVEAFAKARGFDEVITFGASMGAYPALRAGLLLGADRAISVGGVYSWPVGGLLKRRRVPQAFDVLCPCFSDRQVKMVAVTSARHARDVSHLNLLRQTFPATHAVMIDSDQHNVMGYLRSVRLLRLFCACVFEYWNSDIRDELLALLSATARYSHDVQTARETAYRHEASRRRRYAQQLAAMKASTSWRLTEPLRRLADIIKRLRHKFLARP